MNKDFDDALIDKELGGRKETSAGKAFGRLRQSFDPDVLIKASAAFSRSDPGWQIVMNTRLSLHEEGRVLPSSFEKRWHEVGSSSSAGMLGLMMMANLEGFEVMRRILPPVPLDE